jgi:hypothetical protein
MSQDKPWGLWLTSRSKNLQEKRYVLHNSPGLAPQHKNQASKALNPPRFQRLERDSSVMATSCCCWSIPTLRAFSSCSPPISHDSNEHLDLELSLAKTCSNRRGVCFSAKAQGKKVGRKGEEDAGRDTGRRTERPQRAAKDASSRPLSPLRSLGPYLRP